LSSFFYNHKITQHFFFFTKNVFASQKPLLKIQVSLVKLSFSKERFVLKEKQICSFGKAFLSKKRFLVKSRGFYLIKIATEKFIRIEFNDKSVVKV